VRTARKCVERRDRACPARARCRARRECAINVHSGWTPTDAITPRSRICASTQKRLYTHMRSTDGGSGDIAPIWGPVAQARRRSANASVIAARVRVASDDDIGQDVMLADEPGGVHIVLTDGRCAQETPASYIVFPASHRKSRRTAPRPAPGNERRARNLTTTRHLLKPQSGMRPRCDACRACVTASASPGIPSPTTAARGRDMIQWASTIDDAECRARPPAGDECDVARCSIACSFVIERTGCGGGGGDAKGRRL
jgi:hypothetical protein